MTGLRPAIVLLVLFTVLLGGVYPAVVYGLAQGLFPGKANGSLLMQGDTAMGSSLIGQSFTEAKYFWGRPSATTPPYNAAASGASNLSPGNPALKSAVEERIAVLQKADPKNTAPIPVDLLTASASGLDPDISPEAAFYQVPRVARERKLDEVQLRELVQAHVTGPQWGIFGEKRVNVLELNMVLDKMIVQ